MYSFLVIADVPISLSAAFGYLLGLTISYLILTRIGINDERDKSFQKRSMFAISGFFGLVITYFSALVTSIYVSQNPFLVKIVSVAFSFFIVYILRTKYVFL